MMRQVFYHCAAATGNGKMFGFNKLECFGQAAFPALFNVPLKLLGPIIKVQRK
jgi:hypothetical protein